ncbi:hypothetical protein DMB44_05170 [Thermoplasma sp. Kam2015]|nr:hypothetical protein DMB44_05170 [Thermoplasma sp. Kam2015]
MIKKPVSNILYNIIYNVSIRKTLRHNISKKAEKVDAMLKHKMIDLSEISSLVQCIPKGALR